MNIGKKADYMQGKGIHGISNVTLVERRGKLPVEVLLSYIPWF